MKSKKIIVAVTLSLSCVLNAFSQQEQTLMTIDGKPVSKSFFEFLYNKNNNTASAEKKTFDEYVDLFKVFRLKVAEAEAQQLDTAKSFISELNGYRQQLATPYLTNKAMKEQLMKQEYERMKEDIDVSHILIKIEGSKTPADTLAAYKKALEVRNRLQKENFDKVAKEVSIDPSVKNNGGHLGFLSVFWTVYPFEDAAYTTPIGQFSMPIQSQFGYHILKVNGRRPARGKVLVAHIMRFTNDTIPGKNEQAEKDIKAIYAKIKAGEDFGKLAKENSEDAYSAENNGELPWFGPGNMVKEFEDVAFGLKEKGEFSEPFRSQFGWHIVKLLDKKGIDTYDHVKSEVERQVTLGDRSVLVKNAFISSLKKEYAYNTDPKSLKKLDKLAKKLEYKDSIFYLEAQKINKPLCSFADKKFQTTDLISYMKAKKLSSAWISKSLESFVSEQLLDYENNHLEQKYSDFKNLMQEYRDGILLFNISNAQVWEKASKDSVGLAKYFEDHKADYKWTDPRFRGRVISCRDKKTMSKIDKILKTQPEDSIDTRLAALNPKDSIIVKSEANLFAKGANAAVDYYIFKTGTFTPPAKFSFVKVNGKLLNAPETYFDVKGLVTQDYQTYLEKEWIASLQKKHQILVNEDVLKTIKH